MGKFFQINRILNHISYIKLKILHSTERPCVWFGWLSSFPLQLPLPFLLLRCSGTKEWMRAKALNILCAPKWEWKLKSCKWSCWTFWRGISNGRKRVKSFSPRCLMPRFAAVSLYDYDFIWLFRLASAPLLTPSLAYSPMNSVNVRAILNWFFSFNWLKIHWTGFNVIGFDFIQCLRLVMVMRLFMS